MKRFATNSPWFALLLPTYPVVMLYAANQNELFLKDIFLPSAIALCVSFLLCLIGLAFTRFSSRVQVLTWASLTTLSLFLASNLVSTAPTQRLADLLQTTPAIVAGVSLVAGACLVSFFLRTVQPEKLSVGLNVIALSLFITPVASIVYDSASKQTPLLSWSPASAELLSEQNAASTERQAAFSATNAEELPTNPDIYYLIFDRYAREDTLRELYNYDNAPFLNGLRQLGFTVYDQATTNYPNTARSLASSLNATYLDGLASSLPEETTSLTPLYTVIEDNTVLYYLLNKGYTYHHLGSWWEATRNSRHSSQLYSAENAQYQVSEFTSFALLRNTLLGEFVKRRLPSLDPTHAQRITYQMETIPRLAANKGPKFLFAHILAPHSPYEFGPDCELLEREFVDARPELENYRDQLSCTNTLISKMVEEILKNSSRPPLIILQSDEGPYSLVSTYTPSFVDADDIAIQEKYGILSAIYSPDSFASTLPQTITPVNLFRYVFNHYFGENLNILEERNYSQLSDEKPYTFVDLTDRVR